MGGRGPRLATPLRAPGEERGRRASIAQQRPYTSPYRIRARPRALGLRRRHRALRAPSLDPPPPTTHTHAFEAVLDDATCGLLARPPRKPLAGPSTALINTQPSAKFILEVSQKKPPLKPAAHLKVTGPVDQLEASLGSTQQRWRATRAPEAVGQSPPALYTKARQQEKLVPSKGSSASRSRTPVFCVPAASGRGCGSHPS